MDAEAQCLKCADLTIFLAPDEEDYDDIARALIGATTAARNIFDVCNDTDPRPGFNTLLTTAGLTATERGPLNTAFDRCLDNAAVNPGTEASSIQTQALALQENSLTTNVEPEPEISTTNVEPEAEVSTFSPPSVPSAETQESAESTALTKMEKLKQQWLDLLP
jgi:hypothetical protein